ncbi:hypothetical protein GALMADRAFT_276967 [Galerina marginata CBS 339.88]|uniref:NAD(P)-binding domain-containing protein n=1 Tax=Galerina marginata (strain CBS 339.88) TaxID=685588 RepID=A0A067TEK6_GALM3|nr:hypothetical protein GALMADRAFT_276967 [Galerina marginata CBS 339.88]
MADSKSALIIGATGQTGRHLLQNLLASSHFTRVGEYGRKVTPASEITLGKDKLEQKIIDFEKIHESGLNKEKWDVVFITLGTTKALAGSAEAFEKIDRDAAKEARFAGSSQRLIYCSAGEANPKSALLYPRSKGLTEVGLAGLGYTDFIVFRPAFLAGTQRGDHRLAESIVGKITSVLSHVSSAVEIQVSDLAQAMYQAGKLGSDAIPPSINATQGGEGDDKFTLIKNAGALKFAELKD